MTRSLLLGPMPINSTLTAWIREFLKGEFARDIACSTGTIGVFRYLRKDRCVKSLSMHLRVIVSALAAMQAPFAFAQMAEVGATVETDPVRHSGDAADDPAIWIHPTDPSKSLIIGTDKQGGLGVYDLSGRERAFFEVGELNNVDIRYNFPLDDRTVDLVFASNRSDDSLLMFRMNPWTRELSPALLRGFPVHIDEAYGFCLYRSPVTGWYYAFVNDRGGRVEQWRITDFGGFLFAFPVRMFSVGSKTEGMVADDELGFLYIGEEDVGIWKYGAEPGDGSHRVLVDHTEDGGHLEADIEGLTLYRTSDGTGYLIASSQGDSTFAVYTRERDNRYLGSFRIVTGREIDEVTGTDGIAVSNAKLGPLFPNGLFVAQDNDNGDQPQNFKLVPWEAIARSGPFPFVVDTRLTDPSGGSADCNGDGRVTVGDFSRLGRCWTGPEPAPDRGLGPQCLCMDLDGDDEVDLADYMIFQSLIER